MKNQTSPGIIRNVGMSALMAAVLAVTATAKAAVINFGGNTITNDADVLTVGTSVYGYTWGASNVVNGVTFTNTTSINGTPPNTSLTALSGTISANATALGAAASPFSSLTAAYQAVLKGATFSSIATTNTLTLTLSNLTVGRVYAVQLWVNDSRATANGHSETFAGGGNTVVIAENATGLAGGVGQYAIGVFTADGTSQPITIGGSNSAIQLNALQVRDVTGTGYTPPGPPPPAAVLAAYTWNGGSAADSNWSDATNWNGISISNNFTLLSATFTNAVRQSNINDLTGLALGGLTFASSNWSITGNAVTLFGTSIAANASGTNTWGLNSALSAVQTLTQTSAGSVLNLTGLISGTGGFIKPAGANGSGTLNLLNPNNSFSGIMNAYSGTLNYTSLAPQGQPSALGSGTTISVGASGSAATLSYIGTTSGNTDRPLWVTNTSAGSIKLLNNSPNNSSLTFNGTLNFLDPTANDVFGVTLGGSSTGTTTYNGILGSASVALTYFNGPISVSGPGKVVFNAFNNLTGNLILTNNGTLALGSGVGPSLFAPRVTINPGSILDVSAYGGSPFVLGAYASVGYPETLLAGNTNGTTATPDVIGGLVLGGATLNIAGDGSATPAGKVAGTMTINGDFIPANSSYGSSTINMELGSTATAGAGVNDLIQVNGNLDLSQGVVTVNINPYQTALQHGTPYTLISYTGSLQGDASGLTTPITVISRDNIINGFSTATAGKVTVSFSSSSSPPANHLLWQGYGGNANWDVDTTSNWLNGGTLTDYFYPADSVFFDDTASQFNVNLVGTIMPGVVTVTNNAQAYTFSGGLAGAAASLVKQGAGMLTLTGSNSFGGGTLVSGGTLALTAGSAAGNGTITNNSVINIINPDSLSSTILSAPVAGNGTINLPNNEFVQLNAANGLANFSGTINIPNGGSLWVTNTASPATVNVQGTGSGGEAALQVDGTTLSGPVNLLANNTLLGVTAGANGTINGNISDGGQGYAVTVNGNGTLILGGTNSYTGLTTINASVINGGVKFNNPASIAGNVYVNGFGTGGSAAAGGILVTVGTNVTWPAGKNVTLDGSVGRASVRLNPGAVMSGDIILAGAPNNTLAILIDATNVNSPNIFAGNVKLAPGFLVNSFAVRSDTVVSSSTAAQIKFTGNVNIGGGVFQVNSANLTMAGTGNVWGQFIISGKVINGASDTLCTTSLVSYAAANSLDLAGYNQTVAGITNPAATASILDGNASQSGTPNNNVLTINPPSGVTYAFSGVLKNTFGKLSVVCNGPGTQTLSGANAYSGNTTVNGGTLNISQATLATNSTITVAGGAVLNLGFTTTNRVNALVLNGVNQPSGVVYNSANTSGLITGTGSLLVVPAVATNPTNITTTVSGGNLNLAWPADHTGWRLLVQTNNLSAGVSANTNDWMTVAGSASTNQVSLPVNVNQPAEFYRLVYP